MEPGRHVIVALDFDSAAPARALVERLGAAAPAYTVGLRADRGALAP
jgi:orotidine-5'-phosphate decarboxylase